MTVTVRSALDVAAEAEQAEQAEQADAALGMAGPQAVVRCQHHVTYRSYVSGDGR